MNGMSPMGRGPRGPFYEGIAKLAPYLLAVLFVIVGAALAINFVQDRLHPKIDQERFDPVESFSKINSRGMVNVVMKRSDEQR